MDMDLGVSGLASGFDWRLPIDHLMEFERAPHQQLLVEHSAIEQRGTSYEGLKTKLRVLQDRAEMLSDPVLFAKQTTTMDPVGYDDVAMATAANGSAIGSYTFDITQMTSASIPQGVTNIGAAINSTNDVSGLGSSDAGFSTAVTGGSLSINGQLVAISAADSLQDIFDQTSSATNGAATGDLGSGVEDVTGYFLSATGLSGGTLSRGTNLEYSINGASTLISNSNTITESNSGLSGLSVVALETGITQVDVESDTDAVKSMINGFIARYKRIQAMIDKETVSATDDKGKVTAGKLAGQSDAHEVAAKLRSVVFGQVTGLSGTIQRLAHLGIDTNGDNNNLSLKDSEILDRALHDNMSGVASPFTDERNGLANRPNSYLEKLSGDDGQLDTRIQNLANQSTGIDKNIPEMERRVQANREQKISTFVQMEAGWVSINSQLAQRQKNVAGLGA